MYIFLQNNPKYMAYDGPCHDSFLTVIYNINI